MTAFLIAMLAITFMLIRPAVAQIWAEFFIDGNCTQPIAPFLDQNQMFNNLDYWTTGDLSPANITSNSNRNDRVCVQTPAPIGWTHTEPHNIFASFGCENISDTDSGRLSVEELFNQSTSDCRKLPKFFELNAWVINQYSGSPGQGCHRATLSTTWVNNTRSGSSGQLGYNFYIFGRFSCITGDDNKTNEASNKAAFNMLLITFIMLTLLI